MKRIGLLLSMLLIAAQVYAAGAPVRVDEGDTITSISDIIVTSSAAVLIAASNANRAVLNCTTDGPIRWGDATVTVAKGHLIHGNSPFAIRNVGPIYVIAADLTVTVSCTEESWAAGAFGSGVFSP